MQFIFDKADFSLFLRGFFKSHVISISRMLLLLLCIGAVTMAFVSIINAAIFIDLSPDGDLTQSISSMMIAFFAALFAIPYKIFRKPLKAKALSCRKSFKEETFWLGTEVHVHVFAKLAFTLLFFVVSFYLLLMSVHLLQAENALGFLVVLPFMSEMAMITSVVDEEKMLKKEKGEK
ncbi:hypothetical protein [Vibrio crassostreae]|uniref:hypothetical protein n=1 Tax=Vibrio crassostreae TaxID=246167 RepID=UPI001B31433E|nr:hypothetical protein [Vibrio crassostreae]